MGVNYIVEINAIHDREFNHPLSAVAFKMLLKLYFLANKEGWPEWIRVSNGLLSSLVGCSENALLEARRQLINDGWLQYDGKKRSTPRYALPYYSINRKICGYNRDNNEGNNRDNNGDNCGDTSINETQKRENLKNEDDNAPGREVDQAEELAGEVVRELGLRREPSVPEIALVRKWTGWGFSREDVLEACGVTVNASHPSFGYIDKVLENRHSGIVYFKPAPAERSKPRSNPALEYHQRSYSAGGDDFGYMDEVRDLMPGTFSDEFTEVK